MTEADAWAAGLFDGEGTVVVRRRGSRSLPCIQIALGMTDLDVVQRFADYLGVEHLSARKARDGQNKDQWYVALAQPARIAELFEAWRPWLGERRTKAFEEGLAAVRAKGTNPRWRTPEGACVQCGSTEQSPRGGCPNCARERQRRYRAKSPGVTMPIIKDAIAATREVEGLLSQIDLRTLPKGEPRAAVKDARASLKAARQHLASIK